MTRGVCDDADWLAVGGHPLTEEERSAAARYGDRVVQGSLAKEDLAVVLTGSTALLFPSLEEGFGRPFLEALVCGAPVICTGRTEVVGDLGIAIIGDTDPDELARAMQLARSRTIRCRVLEQGPQRANRFSWKAFSETLIDAAVRVGRHKQSNASHFRGALIADHDDLVRGV